MYNNERIGIGIITCNRKESYKRLIEQIKLINDVDFVITVKNKDFDYSQDDPLIICNNSSNFYSEHISEDVGVGYCKNICLKRLLDENCDHIFLIEDDINIKNHNVFKVYIDTAKSYNLQHLNFCMAWDSITKSWLKPSYSINNKDNVKLSVFVRLCGDFEYFTKEVIQHVGMFDAKHYVNAMEHAEHTYRIACAGYTLPFQSYADIYESTNYIEDTGIESSIHYDDKTKELYNARISNACRHFASTYGRSIGLLHIPSPEEVQRFLVIKDKER